MKMHACLVVGAMILTATAPAILAQTRTFRTPASMEGVIQDADLAGKPTYNFEGFIGRDLVNLALGTALGTPRSNEVLAIEFTCDSSSATLVVFDRATTNNLATIATSTSIDVVQQQDKDSAAFPNRERFVTRMDVATLGTSSNGLAGGFLTIAGRVYLNPTNGCPRSLLVDTDRGQDRVCGDPTAVKNTEDQDRTKQLAGRGHFIGVIDMITSAATNTVLVPDGHLSIERLLAP